MAPISRAQKNELLSKYQDMEDDEALFEDGRHHEDNVLGYGTLKQTNEDFYGIDENFQTLTIKGAELANLRASLRNGDLDSRFNLKGSNTPKLRPERHTNDSEGDFLAGFEDLSPGTISTSSPKLKVMGSRKALSEYSEDVDTSATDITSEFNDADMGDIDNIFGFEESGVYNSGGVNKNTTNGGNSKAKALLLLKQRELELKADEEEREMLQTHGAFDKTNTLRLRDFNAYQDNKLDSDALENEKTVNYEYTKDEYEDFEDGFELSSPIRIPTNLRSSRAISSKMSMPQFEKSQNKVQMKKYKSMMDVGEENDEHPFFNNKSNNLMKKLNRIPSFYSKDKPNTNNGIDNLDMIEELVSKNIEYSKKTDLEMEIKKKQLLEKYMEITTHQLKNRHEKSKKSSKRSPNKKKLGSSIGLVRYLNEQSVPMQSNNKMKFNPAKQRWEGNDIDLYKFEKIKSLPNSKPKLISNLNPHKEGLNGGAGDKIVGNMKYDPYAMRWNKISMIEGEIEEESIFDDLPDLPSETIRKHREISGTRGLSVSKSHVNLAKPKNLMRIPQSSSAKSIMSMLKQSSPKYLVNNTKNSRGVSTTSAFTQRTTSSSSSNESDVTKNHDTLNQTIVMHELYLDEKLIERFAKEESKWVKKTKHWFNEGEQFDDTINNLHNRDYLWEIRKMVTEEEN